MIKIENNILEVLINPKGAELTSLKSKETGLEYMWKGDPAFWGKYSPVLFPIVGTLKEHTFYYRDKGYNLPRHGFARDKSFELEVYTGEKAVFLLRSNPDTRLVYPFDFEFRISYQLKENQLQVAYQVNNLSEEVLYFSVGGHPAFAVPLVEGTAYEDYSLVFDTTCHWNRWPISPDGLIEAHSVVMQPASNRIDLSYPLFYGDALVFKGLEARKLRLSSEKTDHGWEFDFGRFPFLGIWAAKGGDFVCVEPWAGIADSVIHEQNLEKKEGIVCLAEEQIWSETWSIRVY